MIKLDLHTHSQASPDGSLTAAQYRAMLENDGLNCIAITDHNRIDFALALHAELGERIIVGEEITAKEGEVIGLFLRKAVAAGLPAGEAMRQIHDQGGLVYVPHPLETVRSGLPAEVLDALAGEIDILEVCNGRAVFQDGGKLAAEWARQHAVVTAASSDAHGLRGWGKTYTILHSRSLPTAKTLPRLLQTGKLVTGKVGLRGLLYPKFNRLRKRGRQ